MQRCSRRESTPTEKNNDNNKNHKNGDRRQSQDQTNKKTNDPNQRVQGRLQVSSRTILNWLVHVRMYSWLENKQAFSNYLTHCVETDPRGIRKNTAGTTEISITRRRSASYSRMRWGNSFVAAIYWTTLMIEEPSHRMTSPDRAST